MLIRQTVIAVILFQTCISTFPVLSATMPVAGRKPNTFGLYDMVGNVWEFCTDAYTLTYDTTQSVNPLTGTNGTDFYQNQCRVARGGSWIDNPFMLRSSNRQCVNYKTRYYHYGFRCARTKTMSVQQVPSGMKLIPAGSYTRGSLRSGDELPLRSISISAFFMDSTEVTQAHYQSTMGTNPSYFTGSTLPVECVSWVDAIRYCNKRSRDEGLDTVYVFRSLDTVTSISFMPMVNGYRLPTEAEWEYTCRGGQQSDFPWGKNLYPATSLDTHEISSYAAWKGNASGLYGPPPPTNVPDIAPPKASIAVVHCSTATQLMGLFTRTQSFASGNKPLTIYLKDGEYDLSPWIWGNNGNGIEINIDVNNTSIIGESKDPTKVIIRGRKFIGGDYGEELLRIRADSVTIAYLTIADVGANGIKIENWGGANPSPGEADGIIENILIHNVYFEDICERSIKVPLSALYRNVTVQYCNFEQVTSILPIHPTMGGHSDGNYIAGMDIMHSVNWRVHHNVFKNIRGISGSGRGGIFMWVRCDSNIVEDNIFYGCDRAIALGNPSGDSLHVSHTIVRNNIVVQGVSYALELCHNSGNKIYNNTFFGYKPDLGLWNRAAFHLWQNYDGNQIKNNIVFGGMWLDGGTMPDTQTNVVVANNGASYPVDWFVDTSRYNFRLTNHAVNLIDHGTALPEVVMDFDSVTRTGSPDIGAFEYHNGSQAVIHGKHGLSERLLLEVIPEIYYRSVTIGICRQHAPSNLVNRRSSVSVQIYSVSGRLISDLSSAFEHANVVKWGAGNQAAGHYVIVASYGEQHIAKEIQLLK